MTKTINLTKNGDLFKMSEKIQKEFNEQMVSKKLVSVEIVRHLEEYKTSLVVGIASAWIAVLFVMFNTLLGAGVAGVASVLLGLRLFKVKNEIERLKTTYDLK